MRGEFSCPDFALKAKSRPIVESQGPLRVWIFYQVSFSSFIPAPMAPPTQSSSCAAISGYGVARLAAEQRVSLRVLVYYKLNIVRTKRKSAS